MFSKLSMRNVSRSLKDYTVYFLTLTFGVCVFYVFNSIDSQRSMLMITERQDAILESLTQLIGIVSVFISVILGFLILYANRFLIRRRKKELGLYLVLGMERGQVSRILVLETFLIGVISLAAGLTLGIFGSQALAALTAKLFEVQLKEFTFVFSIGAFGKTILYFGIIFLLVMLFNAFSIAKYKLIDLIRAGRKNETPRVRRLWTSVVLFVLSAICLGTAYGLIMENGLLVLNRDFFLSISLGTVGTFLFFWSLTGFMLRLTKTVKGLYYKNLNMFILRQLSSKINTTFVSASLICLMLFFTIGLLSSGMGMADVLTRSMNEANPYDAVMIQFRTTEENQDQTAMEMLAKNGISLSGIAGKLYDSTFYRSNITYREIMDEEEAQSLGLAVNVLEEMQNSYPSVVSLSDYNGILRLAGLPPVELADDEYAINSDYEPTYKVYNQFLKSGTTITCAGQTLHPAFSSLLTNTLQNGAMKMDVGTLVLPDQVAEQLQPVYSQLNVQYIARTEEYDRRFVAALDKVAGEHRHEMNYTTRLSMFQQSAALKTVISYLAIYIGVVFLITSAAVLALQQLSEASDNAGRYLLLGKLGAEPNILSHALFVQIAISFVMPLLLAVVHSIVGIKVACEVVAIYGKVDIMGSTLMTAAVILAIYGGYFLATYLTARGILRPGKSKRR